MSSKQLVINLTPNQDEALKPAELIKMQAAKALSLYERRAVTILWHNAHKQKLEKGKQYTIPLADLRTDTHNGNEHVRTAIKTLQQPILSIQDKDGDFIEDHQLLGSVRYSNASKSNGLVTYEFPNKIFDILKESWVWGRIEIPVLMHLGSKYSISLYEHISQLVNLDYKSSVEFTLEEFRRVISIEDGKYTAFGGLNKHIIKKSVDEINALADFSISVVPVKSGKKVTHVHVHWHQKNEDQRREAYAELQRHKTGRRARIEGRVEHVKPVPGLSDARRKAKRELPKPDNDSPISSQLDDIIEG